MIDIHAHILAGVDDGAESLKETLAMAELAEECGVKAIVATPHSNVPWAYSNYYDEDYTRHFKAAREYLKANGCSVELIQGMEIYGTKNAAKKIQKGELIGINHSRYYLVEVPFDADARWAEEIFYSVLDLGKVPVIAHPERYRCVKENPELLYRWMQDGCLSQVNKGSIFGRFGRQEQKTAEILLDHHLVTCFASDAHSPYARTTYLGDIQDFLIDFYGEERMIRLLYENPARMIEDKKLVHANMRRPESSRGFRLF